MMLNVAEEAHKRYNGDSGEDERTGEPIRIDDWGYSEGERRAFIAGAKFELEQVIEFIQRLKQVQEDNRSIDTPMQMAMDNIVIGELDGILHVLEKRNAEQ